MTMMITRCKLIHAKSRKNSINIVLSINLTDIMSFLLRRRHDRRLRRLSDGNKWEQNVCRCRKLFLTFMRLLLSFIHQGIFSFVAGEKFNDEDRPHTLFCVDKFKRMRYAMNENLRGMIDFNSE